MALADPCCPHDVHDLSNYDCHVAGSCSYARVGRVPAEVDDPCQPLCHVILLLLDSHDLRCSLGLRQLLYKQSVEMCHVTAVFWRDVQDDFNS